MKVRWRSQLSVNIQLRFTVMKPEIWRQYCCLSSSRGRKSQILWCLGATSTRKQVSLKQILKGHFKKIKDFGRLPMRIPIYALFFLLNCREQVSPVTELTYYTYYYRGGLQAYNAFKNVHMHWAKKKTKLHRQQFIIKPHYRQKRSSQADISST